MRPRRVRVNPALPQSPTPSAAVPSPLRMPMSVYVEDHGLGAVTGEQGGYRLDPAHPRTTELAPDVAFVKASRLPPRNAPDYH